MGKAVFPIAQEHGVVVISPTSNAPGLSAIGDFVFRTSLSVDRLLPSGVATTQQALGYRRVATLYDRDDVFSQGSDAAFKKAFRDNGVEVLISETFQTGDTDFSAQLTRIKEANIDAISLSALPTEMPEIMIQGRQLGIPFEIPFICPTLVIGEVQRAGDAAEGAITIALWSEKADTPGQSRFHRKLSREIWRRTRCVHRAVLHLCPPLGKGHRRCPIDGCERDSRRLGKTPRCTPPFWATSRLTPMATGFTTRLL